MVSKRSTTDASARERLLIIVILGVAFLASLAAAIVFSYQEKAIPKDLQIVLTLAGGAFAAHISPYRVGRNTNLEDAETAE